MANGNDDKIVFDDLSEEEQAQWLEDFAKSSGAYKDPSDINIDELGRETTKKTGFEGRTVSYEEKNPDGSTMITYLSSEEEKRKENVNKLKEGLKAYGKPANNVITNLHQVSSRIDPTRATGLEENYIPKVYENQQSWITDFGESLYEGLVLNTVEGIGNLIPTVYQAFGSPEDEFKKDWSSGWIENVSGFVNNISPTYSDAYYKGDTSRRWATGLGQGIGFVAGIMLGGGTLAKGISKLGAGARSSQRIGSFLAGTTMMYPSIYEEARKNGINPAHSARLALGISGVVSLTEGAALEMIGKTVSKPILKQTTNKILKDELKVLSVKSLDDVYLLEQRVVKGLGNKLKALKVPVVKGAAIEAGQEFSQTYIEEGIKQMYDTIVAPDKKAGEGAFGADISTKETFDEAVFSAAIGGIIGGGLGGGGSIMSGVKQETAYGYIKRSVDKKNNTGISNIAKLNRSVDELKLSGQLNEQEAEQVRGHINKMTKYAMSTKGLNLKDNVASYQMFQLNELQNEIVTNIDSKFAERENLSKAVLDVYSTNREMGNKISSAINKDMTEIVDNKKAYTKNKGKFEKRLAKYSELAKNVSNNEVTEEQFDEELSKITKDVSDTTKKQQKAKDKAVAVEYKTDKGAIVTQSAMESAESILKDYNEALDSGKEVEFQTKLKKEHGIDKEGLRFLVENQGSTIQEMKANLKELEVMAEKVTEKTEPQLPKTKTVDEIKQELAETGVSVEFADDETYEEPTSKEEGMKGKLAVQKAVDTLAEAGYKPTERVVAKPTKKAKEEVEVEEDAEISDIEKRREEELEIGDISAEEINIKYDAEIAELKEKRKAEEIISETDVLIKQVQEQENLNDKDLDAIIKEADEKGIMSPELLDAVSERRAQIKEEIKEPIVEEAKEIKKVVEEAKIPVEEIEEIEEPQSEEEIDNAVDEAKNFLNEDEIPKEQRIEPDVKAKETIRQNPVLQKKIVDHFRKIFPNVPVKEVNRIASEYGGEVLGRVVEKGIEIDSSFAFQNTIIHEYAHVYIQILGKNDPIIKLGLELIEDTDYFRDAQKKYPDLSKADQLEEALAEAIADNSYDKLKLKFEGTKVDKFVAFLKKFWARIKRQFTKNKSKDIVSIISDGMTFGSLPFTYDTKVLNGVNKEQRASKKAVEATSMVQGYLSRLRIHKVENPDFAFDPNNSAQVSRFIYDAFKVRYEKEKAGELRDDQIKIFDGISVELVPEETKDDVDANRTAIINVMQKDMPNLFPIVQRSIESFTKNPLPTLDEITSDSAVKASKKISESLRSIVTSIIDYDGRSIESDNIYRYVADLATNTYGKKGFEKQLKLDAENNVSVEASRFYEMMGQMPEGIKQSILSELSSLVQTKYRGVTLIKDKLTGIARLGQKIVNKDESLKAQLEDSYRRLESLSNDYGLTRVLQSGHWQLLKHKNSDEVRSAKETIEGLFDVAITDEDFSNFYDEITSKTEIGLSSFLMQIQKVLNGDESGQKAISGYATKLFNNISDKTALTNTFPNMSGNSVSSTNFGYFISEQASMMFNKEGHLDKMKKNPIYKNNPVFKMIVDKFEKKGIKDIDWSVHDALSNMFTNKAIDHAKQYQSDTVLIGLSYFANTTNKDEYDQSMGISGDRTKITTVKAPRFKNMTAITEQLKKDATTQQNIFNKRVKGIEVGSEQYNSVVDNFNSMYMNKVIDGKVITPSESSYPKDALADIQKNIATIKEAVRDNKLTDAISKDLVGPTNIYKDLNELVGNYYYTEAINRNALMDLFAGVMLDRKSVADVVKRGSGYNSGGTLIEHDKPVTFVVYDVPSEVVPGEYTSDSMSIDGTHLHQHTMDDAGTLGNVGTNKKDFIFQVDPSTSKTLMVKMSTIGIEVDENGENNFSKMGPEYSRMADAFLKAEKYFAEKSGDNKPHVKFVDSKTMKGNDGNYKVVKLTDLLNDIENDNFSSLEDASFEKEITNHRVAFNLNKDLSKIPLSQQESVLSTQERTIASTKATQVEIESFEGAIVDMLQESLGMTNDDYNDSKTNKDLKNNQMFLDELLKGSDEQKANSISQLLYDIKEYNQNNPGAPITVYDDPNLVNLVQQFIATKFTKDGIRTKMAGAYLHMLPNYGNDLAWYDYEGGGHPEVALPMSMFVQQKEGETIEDYQSRADVFLSDSNERGGLRVVIVRVPASKGMSTFVANVKYFTDPKVNTVIVPDGFIKASDADHDGDKTFVYREDINNDGTINNDSLKTKAFNKLHERISSPALIEETKDSLNLKPIKDILKKYNLDQTEAYKLTDTVEAAKIAEQMGFGGEAVGILAIASKMLAVMSQSKEQLKSPIKFGYNMTMDEGAKKHDGELLFGDQAKEYQKFVDDQGSDMARLLQAALDMGNDPILMSTGINQETISVATTLSLLGVDTESIIGFLNDDAIVNFNNAVSKANSGFGLGEGKAAYEVREDYIKEKSPEAKRFKTIKNLEEFINRENGIIKNIEEGTYMTEDGKGYFTVTEVDENKIGRIELIEEIKEGDISIIDKYLEIKDIADNLKQLIPILQLDSKLPNTGTKIHNLQETISEIKSEEYPITVDKLLSRPLVEHQEKVAELQRRTSKNKFITENDFFYSLENKLNTSTNRNPKKAIDNSFMQQHAQKNLRKQHSDPKSFVYGFAEEINNIIYSGIVGEPNVADKDWKQLSSDVKGYIEMRDETPQEYMDAMVALPDGYKNKITNLMEKYEDALNDFDKNSELSKNKFINALQTSWKETEVQGDKVKSEFLIKSKPGFNNASPTVKQEIKDAFLELPQDMQDKFVDYQLLRHGVNEKMGSLMGMLPNSLMLKPNTLADISTIAQMNKEDYFKNQKELIQRNTALSMFNKLNEPKLAERVDAKSDNLLAWNGRDAYIKKGENVYERTNEKADIKGYEIPVYKKITNSEFVAGKDFTKFGTQDSLEKSKVTDDQVKEEMKKCKI